MSTPYIRRPNLEGNTDVSVLSQPYLQGTVRRSADGTVSGFAALVATVPADLVVETEGTTSGPVTVTFTAGHSALLNEIIATLNSALSGIAVASERDGCLRLATAGVGETATGRAFIRVHAATNDWNGDGFADDCAAILGFATYPNVAATCTAGDIESSATRPLEQGNAPGTRFVARGEDRLSIAFNRGLAQLASNTDVLRTAGYREAAYPVAVPIDSTLSTWSGRFRYDAAGSVTQISLADLDTVDGNLTGRIYVGGLSATSTLHEIAGSFFVTDTKGHELSAYDESAEEVRTIRVGAVTRGENGFGAPSFADEESAPTSALPDTAAATPDGRNALGVNRTKVASAVISKIHNKTSLVCSSLGIGTGFISLGVVPGDIAEIAFSTVTSPYTNDGKYLVEAVVSEQEIVVRPSSDTDVLPLNDSTSGSFGTVTVSSGGEWESDIWVTLTPPLARFPEDGKIVLVFGIERETLNQREDANTLTDDASFKMLQPGLTGFEIEQLWQRQGLGGAYAGMSTDRTSDAGSVLLGRKRPVTIVAPEKSLPSAGTYVRGPFTGNLLGQGILKAEYAAVPPHPDTFTLADIGRVVKLSGGGGAFVDLEPFLITEFIDGAHVRVAPLGASPGSELTSTLNVQYEVYEDVVEYPSALLHLVAPDEDRGGVTRADVGILYVREQNDGGSPPLVTTRKHGQSLVHLERVSVGYGGSFTATNLRTITVSAVRIDGGTSVVDVGVPIEEFQNVFAIEGGDTRPVEAPYNGGSVFRIFNGPNAGYYLVQRTYSTNEIRLVTLDGEDVLLDTTVATSQIGAFYNAHVAVGHTLVGKYGDVAYRTAKLRVFFDSLEQGEESSTGISLDWRGEGSGISAQLNDADFVAYDAGSGAFGYLLDAQIYSPAHGLRVAGAGADYGMVERRSLRGLTIDVASYAKDPATSLTTLPSWGAWVAQKGDDPALVVTKTTGLSAAATGEPVDLSYFQHSGAAVKIYTNGASAARGGGIDIIGSIYQRQYSSTVLGTLEDVLRDGGITTEVGFSAKNYAVAWPGLAGTSLGLPEKLAPAGHADAWISVEILAPDYSLYAEQHVALVKLPPDTVSVSLPSAYVGQQLFFSGLSTRYRIAQLISSDSTEQIVALLPNSPTDVALTPTTTTACLVGGRWTRTYADIADWTMIGTALNINSAELPWLSIAESLEDTVVSAPTAVGTGDIELESGALQSSVSAFPTTLGSGVGPIVGSYEGEVHRSAAAYDLDAGFEARYCSYTYEHGWSRVTGQPRAPIPNTAIFSGKTTTELLVSSLPQLRKVSSAPVGLSMQSPGFLNDEEIALELVSGTGTVTAEYDSAWGGNIKMEETDGVASTVRLWFPSVRGVSPYLHKFNFELNYALTAAALGTGTVALRRADGTILVEESLLSLNNSGSMTIRSLTLTASRSLTVLGPPTTGDMRGPLASTALSEDADAPLFLTLDIPFEANAVLNIGSVSLTPIVQPLRTPALEVPTVAKVGSLRYVQPVKGFETISPLQAELLDGTDYAAADGAWTPVSGLAEYEVFYNRGGGQEGRGVGAFNEETGAVTSWEFKSPVYDRGRFFRKGRASTAIVGYHPFYDPLFYVLAAPSQNPSLVGSEFIPPGVTGFLLPFSPPHGSTLTNFNAVLSVKPVYTADGGGTWTPTVQVWQYGTPLLGAIGYEQTDATLWKNQTGWDVNVGMRLVIYRQNCIDFGVEDAPRSAADVASSAGYFEVIYTAPININTAELVPISTSSATVNEVLTEITVPVSESFTFSNPGKGIEDRNLSAFVVDRRHYSYFAAIEFYIGIRSSDGTTVDIPNQLVKDYAGAVTLGSIYGSNTWGGSHQISTLSGLGGPIEIAADKGVSLSAAPKLNSATIVVAGDGVLPGAVKFRGARVGWVTDRAGDGGWG